MSQKLQEMMRMPKIGELFFYGVKPSPAMVVMGVLMRANTDYCMTWSVNAANGLVSCVSAPHEKDGFEQCDTPVAICPVLLPYIQSAQYLEPYGKIIETEYEGFGGSKPITDSIAKQIIKNRDKCPKTGKTYPVYNHDDGKWEDIPEFLYNGEKYVILTGQPCNKDSKIDGVSVRRGKQYVFKIEKLRVKENGLCEYPVCVGPLGKKTSYTDMRNTFFWKNVRPKIEASFIPSQPTEELIRASFIQIRMQVNGKNVYVK